MSAERSTNSLRVEKSLDSRALGLVRMGTLTTAILRCPA
jgi:hypothetical protein